MLYKILLTLESNDLLKENQELIIENLEYLHWSSINKSCTIWTSEKAATDYLSAKLQIERDLSKMFNACKLNEIKYAFQLSLLDITQGKLKLNAN